MQHCEMQGVVAVVQMSEREHLSVAKRSLASAGVSNPTERLELGDQLLTSQ